MTHHLKRGNPRLAVIAGLLLAVGMGTGVVFSQDDAEPPTRSSRPAKPAGTSSASDTGKDKDLAAIERKLDQIIQTQSAILQKFDAVMEELRIIKVRATIRGS